MTELQIDRLGHLGDGMALHDGKPVFVPFALPGETVTVSGSGEHLTLETVLSPSPDRIAPACGHYGICGGCVLQHLAPAPYAAFKRQLVIDALADRGLTPEVAPAVLVPAGSRRRATFAGLMAGSRPLVGFNERGSHRLVTIEACPVLLPNLIDAEPALLQLTGRFQPRKGAIDLTVTATDTGFDLSVRGVAARDIERLRFGLIELAASHDLARLSVMGEVIVERRPPTVSMDGVAVVLPPGGFLQASRAAEEAMAGLVVAAVGKAKRVADLFSGVGTFALRLARTADVLAVEGDAPAVAALDKAARGMTGRHRITAERRDLSRRPMVEKELEKIDAVVFDPPRAGAREQSEWLAKSKVPTVVAVSCNPATLARDLRILVDGGYAIESVTPVDQFLWSNHVEAVAVLRR
nr:class I SAM-dependent RNA methyltransferase [Oryzibacter oryziterrae]